MREIERLKSSTKAFALGIIRSHAVMANNDAAALVLGGQVLRSAASEGANHREASVAGQRRRGVSRIGGRFREIQEAVYWLERPAESRCVFASKMAELRDKTRQPIPVFAAIHKKAKGRTVAFSLAPSACSP